MAVIFVGVFLFHYFTRYNVPPNALSLLPKTSVDTKLIQAEQGIVNYSAADDKMVKDKIVLANATDATNGRNLYEASVDLDPSKGLTFSQTTPGAQQSTPSVPGLPAGAGQPDQNAKLGFTLTPLGGGVQQGRLTDGRLQYPSEGGQRFYTFRKNGIAEDILLTKAPANTATYQWKLNLPSSLEARMMGDGSVGIYSANPNLFGNIQVGDQKSQALLDKARKNGTKDTLAFVLPAPFIKTLDGKTDGSHTRFSLDKASNILTLTATGLQRLSYPLSIDPSVVISTTNDLRLGYDDGMIDYTTTADQITRANLSGGAVGAVTTQSSAFTTVRTEPVSVVYNGYIYIAGGFTSSSSTGCTTGSSSNWYCDDIQYSQIKSDGSLCLPGSGFATCTGTVFTQQTGAFTTARTQFSAAVYNGYLYLIAGWSGSARLDDIQRCPLNATNGSVGTCIQQSGVVIGARNRQSSVISNGYLYIIGGIDATTTQALNTIDHCPINADGSIGTCVQQSGAFTTARFYHTSVVYNNYLYIIGGCTAGNCTGYLNDIQYCPINTNGTIGTCVQESNAFTTAREIFSSVVYKGYLYIIGGFNSTQQSDVQYCPVNANGSIGICTQQTSAITLRNGQISVVYDDYIYVAGGYNGSYLNDVQRLKVQSMGTAGPGIQQTNAFTNGRSAHGTVVYNGFLYIIGGINLVTYYNDILYCPLNADGSVGTCTQKTNAFTTTRANFSSVVYNGFIYIMGGSNSGTLLNDTIHCAINSDGSVGTCTSQTSSFATTRYGHSSIVYNGYVYIIGGCGAGNCTNILNDVQYAWLNPSTGAACLPSNHATCTGTVFAQQTNAFPTPRYYLSAATYNGYLYISGGYDGSAYRSDIVYCPLSTNGSVGSCTQQNSAFTTQRGSHSMAVYNNYLLIIAGFSGSVSLTDIQYCPLNPNGSVGTCVQQNNMITTARFNVGVAVSNNYLYTTGGYTGSYVNDIQRFWLGQMGQVGSTTQQTSAFTTTRRSHTSVVYNGYLYIVGGYNGSAQNDIQYCPLNSDGTTGACHFTCNGTDNGTTTCAAFGTARYYHASVVYNGYLYIIGGQAAASATGCDSNGYCSDIQFCALNTNGTVATCHYTHNGIDDGASFAQGAFASPRRSHTSVVYNGYLYIIGGLSAASATGCNASGYCGDIQFCAINTNGTVATCHWTHAGTDDNGSFVANGFTTNRLSHASVVYNGYLYIIGGLAAASATGCDSNGYCGDIQYCQLNSNGTVGTCTQELNAFTKNRYGMATAIANGNLYIIGGYNGSPYLSDIQNCPISSAGWVGVCNFSGAGFTSARFYPTSVIYNGFLYIVGGQASASATGCDGSGYCNDIQYLPLSSSPQLADYEKTFDVGTSSGTIQSISYGRNASTDDVCGVQLWYATAGSNGQFGSWTVIPQAFAGTTYSINATNQRYVLAKLVLDDRICGGQSNIADITVNYIAPPSVPTISTLAPNTTGLATLTPAFTFKSSDALNDNLQYRVKVCTDAALTVNCQNATQVTGDAGYSQTGWSGQDKPTACSGGSCVAYKGDATLANSTLATYTYTGSPALNWGTQYYWQATACDATDTTNGCTSTATQNFTTNFVPSAPILSAPSSSQTGLSTTPEFHLYSTDGDSDYLRYEIIVYDSNCSTQTAAGTGTYDENTSQTGWSGQSTQSGTAYSAGQTAIYKLQTTLTAGTTYCWKAAAKDPGGSNTFGSFSGTQTFTTNSTSSPKTVRIGGNVNIGGGNVTIKP